MMMPMPNIPPPKHLWEVLATKPVIAGSGCNFQRHCADAVFLGVGYKFNDFIQSIHRIYRFQQKREVNIHIVHLESEDAIVEELKAKWARHNEMMATMRELLIKNKLENITAMELTRTLGCERMEAPRACSGRCGMIASLSFRKWGRTRWTWFARPSRSATSTSIRRASTTSGTTRTTRRFSGRWNTSAQNSCGC